MNGLFNSLPPKEAFFLPQGPKVEAVGVPGLKDEKPGVQSPSAPCSRLHFMKSGSVRGGFHDGHSIGNGIEQSKSYASPIGRELKGVWKTVNREQSSRGGTVEIHRVDVKEVSIVVNDPCSIRSKPSVCGDNSPNPLG